MSGRLSPIEEVHLVAKVADLKLELERHMRTMDALIALLEDKGLLDSDELQEKAWLLHRRSLALRQAARPRMQEPAGVSVPAFLRGRKPDAAGPGFPPGRGGSGMSGPSGPSGSSG